MKVSHHFKFRGHYIIVFELLNINLYKWICDFPPTKKNQHTLQREVWDIAIQMLNGLIILKSMKIIHCDLKPENVLFTNEGKKTVKIIDFGSACDSSKTGFSGYVQSRFYRCPEITMGLPYSQAADMWSFGCILFELITGRPIFPALDESELMEFFKIRIGDPKLSIGDIYANASKKHFYDQAGNLIRSPKSRIPENSPICSDTIRSNL